MKHDPLCRQRYQGWEDDKGCSDCDLILRVREDEMTEYVQLRESDDLAAYREFIEPDPIRARMVNTVSKALMENWFPREQPKGEDLEEWEKISVLDATIAVKALLEGAWLDDPTMD